MLSNHICPLVFYKTYRTDLSQSISAIGQAIFPVHF